MWEAMQLSLDFSQPSPMKTKRAWRMNLSLMPIWPKDCCQLFVKVKRCPSRQRLVTHTEREREVLICHCARGLGNMGKWKTGDWPKSSPCSCYWNSKLLMPFHALIKRRESFVAKLFTSDSPLFFFISTSLSMGKMGEKIMLLTAGKNDTFRLTPH